MYRGVLKRLISLYSAQILVQLEVSAFQKMPYFKDFEFPVQIEDYLGPVFNDLVNRKLPKMFSKKGSVQLLNELFKTSDLVSEELKMPSIMEPKEAKGSVIDLGQQVKRLKSGKNMTKIRHQIRACNLMYLAAFWKIMNCSIYKLSKKGRGKERHQAITGVVRFY